MAFKTYSIIQTGSPSFPIFQVWLDPVDENGFLVEHECTMLAQFPTMQQAKQFLQTYPLT
ncbi:hypothetical protein UFOVP116_348 [uncultured Caudovirales phage]|uniref:Uncharacterized protein n=1 Tax=uncultured Caudovirales phage TaxID=2100421 RepID=A0A6J5LB56_9CAUD|nr:hypothetical protein UFOVP116_348 [uncultured Caudovirales phage]